MSHDERRRPRMPREGRLGGRSIFLSASVPHPERDERYRSIHEAQVEIEDAVVALARAVFAEGGRLVFGGHPSISPLVALVAGEYMSAPEPEPTRATPAESEGLRIAAPVVIHQLESYRTDLPDATRFMEALGHAQIVWSPVDESERFTARPSSTPAYPLSLKRMRSRMIEDPSLLAMVCIGGMEGVEEEMARFIEAKPGLPVFVLARTGGAAARIANEPRAGGQSSSRVRVIDEEVLGRIQPLLRDAAGKLRDAPLRYMPYALIMQVLVEDVTKRSA